MTKCSIVSVYTDLEQMLDTVIRDHLNIEMVGKACITFNNINNWEIVSMKEPGKDATEQEWYEFHMYHCPTYAHELYYGSCNVASRSSAFENEIEQVQIRLSCELLHWIAVAQVLWTIKVWVKEQDGTVTRYYFTNLSLYGSYQNTMSVEDVPKDMKLLPPKRIAFTQKEVEEISV